MPEPKVSVIVPIYSTSTYLNKCVDSILNQTLKEIEIILVNDASPDAKDHEICMKYSNDHENIVYMHHNENMGGGSARNTGIMQAKGTYITFIDSDDWLENTMLEELYTAIKKKKADIAQCFFYDHFVDEGTKRLRRVKSFRKFPDRLNSLNALVWNKLYKRDVFIENGILFPEKISSHDVVMMSKLIYYVNRVVLVRKPLYHYRANRQGAITSDFKKLLNDLPQVFKLIKDFLLEINRFEKDQNFYEKRVLKSLIHHLKRFRTDTSMGREEKNSLINERIANSLEYLRLCDQGEIKTLDEAITTLVRYRSSLRLKMWIGLF